MKSLFDRWLPALTLALWGGTILFYKFTGRLDVVLWGEYRTYAVIAAGFLLAGAVVFALNPVDAACCADSACGHGLSRSRTGRLLTFAIILLPIGLSFFGSAQQLQAVQARNRTTMEDKSNLPVDLQQKLDKKFANRPGAPAPTAPVPAPVSSNTPPAPANPGPPAVPKDIATTQPPALPGAVQPPPPLPLPGKDGSTPAPDPNANSQKPPTDYLSRNADGMIIAEVIDLLYAAQDATLQKDFEGKQVELTGQFLPDRAATPAPGTPTRFKAVRMLMTCCAADARPIATLVEVDQLPQFADMEWVRIVGTPTFPVEKGRRISVLKAQKIEKTAIPADELNPAGPQ